MILNRYMLRVIIQGVLLALAVLVSISLFFTVVGELDKIGRGYYGMLHITEYAALRIPGKVVEFMPLAVLIGTILSLGALAGNSEIIAMQAAGVSVAGLLRAVIQPALLLALLTFLVADFVAPASETSARAIRSAAINNIPATAVKQGIWIKDGDQVIHIKALETSGRAQGIQIYQLGEDGTMAQLLIAQTAVQTGNQWRLQQVEKVTFGKQSVQSENISELIYSGKISTKLLDSLLIEPRQMSTMDLYNYQSFLAKNNLDDSVESLTLWQKLFTPLTVIVMCLLAVPFVLGSQRQGHAGQRLIIGILLGLAYVTVSRLLTQLGVQINLLPVLNALAPSLLFFALAIYLLHKKTVL